MTSQAATGEVTSTASPRARGNTRERLLLTALELFSVRGFGGTSIRDLAKAVGIKESSVYKHFTSKQHIFDALLTWTQERYAQAAARLGLVFDDAFTDADQLRQVSLEQLTAMTLALYDFSVEDPVAGAFRRLLTVEQFRDERAQQLLHSYFLTEPTLYQAQIFAALMDQGVVRRADPEATALAFWAPLWLLMGAAETDRVSARHKVVAHIGHFVKTHQEGGRHAD